MRRQARYVVEDGQYVQLHAMKGCFVGSSKSKLAGFGVWKWVDPRGAMRERYMPAILKTRRIHKPFSFLSVLTFGYAVVSLRVSYAILTSFIASSLSVLGRKFCMIF